MKLINVFRQTEEMVMEEKHPWRWFIGMAIIEIVWCFFAMFFFEPYSPIMIATVVFLMMWISGIVGFYRNQWFFIWDFGLPKLRKFWFINILCLNAVTPFAIQFSGGVLEFLLKILLGSCFCIFSYSFAGGLGKKSRDK
ncbi:MAG: hypothetical protein HFI93_04225 [Lachnospiraceae bacterium]|nr:hypothetical protein [Lachnospiraceae bacterium]